MNGQVLYITAVISGVFCTILFMVWLHVRKHDQKWTIMPFAAAVVFGVATIAQVALAAKPPAPTPPPTSSSPSTAPSEPKVGPSPSPSCSATPGPADVQVKPYGTAPLVFCPVRINNGTIPITGPFNLSGQILGPDAERRHLILFVRIDPKTRDTCGKPGGRGRFLLPQEALDADAEGKWSYDEKLGDYPQGVTFGRTYEIATAPQSVIDSLMSQKDGWKEDGINELPDSVEILAAFEVPPGVAGRDARCVR
ncbi:hypothetical protein AB0B63_28390 [Micromonospora sp. NPDC049081]|uniref:hypothetical protein n=1 Tax=Micromonospora sp. NPDC049081 TaxID=3155150 RepID=UPI0033FF6629